MKTTLSVFALSALAAFALAGEAPIDTAKKLAADYRSATLKKDLDAFSKGSTSDFVYIDGKGRKADKAQALAGMKGFYGMMTFTTMTVTAASAKVAPGGIIYIQETKLAGSMKMGGPKPSKFTSTSRDEVYAVKQGGRWLTKRVKNLKTVDLIDGKPMPGM